jgi:prophage regulatory protein
MSQPKLLRLDDVVAITGLSRSSIYARAHAKTFPGYIKIGPRGTRWLESEVIEFIESCKQQCRGDSKPESIAQTPCPSNAA